MTRHSNYPWIRITRSESSIARAKRHCWYWLYLMRFSFGEESESYIKSYIKCGITRDITKRKISFTSAHQMIRGVELIFLKTYPNQFDATKNEHMLQSMNDSGSHAGLVGFSGSTECYHQFKIDGILYRPDADVVEI